MPPARAALLTLHAGSFADMDLVSACPRDCCRTRATTDHWALATSNLFELQESAGSARTTSSSASILQFASIATWRLNCKTRDLIGPRVSGRLRSIIVERVVACQP